MKKTIQAVKGTRDFYPEEMSLRTWLYEQIRQVSQTFGYQEYEGPILESLELYAAKSGEELVKEQSFVFPDRGGKMITLRPELTPTLARLVAQRQFDLPFPIRWWSFGPMWRYEQPQAGRTREFFQWNIDQVGSESAFADAELIAVGVAFLKQVGLTPQQVQILVNNRRLMDAEMEDLGIADDLRRAVIRLIDRKEKLAPEAWQAYAVEIGLSEAQIQGLAALLANNDLWKKSPELIELFQALDALGAEDYVRFAPYTIRGLDYYTGTVFECFDRLGKYRSIFAGGRYDNLVADVGGNPVSGVGFAMGDKVVSLVLEEFDLLPDTANQPQAEVLVTVFNPELMLESLAVATTLRVAGLRVACYPLATKLGKQLKYASKIQARIALIMGPDEAREAKVNLKDLISQEQVTVPRAEVVTAAQDILARQDSS